MNASNNGTQNGSNERPRLVAVTGAGGFVGRAVVRELLGRGLRVRGLVRTDPGAARAALPGGAQGDGRLELIGGDVLGEGTARRLVAGADACCNLVGIIREVGGGQSFERAHVDATRAAVGACEEESVKRGTRVRFVHMSALGADGDGASEYQRTKFGGEQIVRLSRLGWTIFRPGLIHGAGGEFMRQAKAWCEGRALPWMFVPYLTRPGARAGLMPRCETPRVAPVRVEDVAWAFAEALERDESIGEVYPLVGGEELGMDEMLGRLRDALPLGRRSNRVVGLPGPLAVAKAKALGAISMGDMLPFDEGMARMAMVDSTASNAKAEQELGFRAQAYTPSMRVYAGTM